MTDTKQKRDKIDELRQAIFNIAMDHAYRRPVSEHQMRDFADDIKASIVFWSLFVIGVCFILMLLVRA